MAGKNHEPDARPLAVVAMIEPAGGPEKPAVVAADPVASAEWDLRVGSVQPAEGGLLMAYCLDVSRLVRLQEAFAKLTELTVESDAGAVKMHPMTGAITSLSRVIGMNAARLGFTPVDRGRVAKPKSGAVASPKPKGLSKYIQ